MHEHTRRNRLSTEERIFRRISQFLWVEASIVAALRASIPYSARRGHSRIALTVASPGARSQAIRSRSRTSWKHHYLRRRSRWERVTGHVYRLFYRSSRVSPAPCRLSSPAWKSSDFQSSRHLTLSFPRPVLYHVGMAFIIADWSYSSNIQPKSYRNSIVFATFWFRRQHILESFCFSWSAFWRKIASWLSSSSRCRRKPRLLPPISPCLMNHT